MNNNKASILLIATGAFLFNIVFWNEQLGINAVLFDVFLISSIFFLYTGAWKNPGVKYLLILHLAGLCTLVIFNSMLSKIAFSITLLLLVAFTEYVHRSVWLAGGSLLLSFLHFTGGFFKLFKGTKLEQKRRFRPARLLRFAILPLLTGLVFFIIYCSANTVFAGMVNSLTENMEKLFDGLSDLFSFSRMMFLAAGFYLTGALLTRTRLTSFEKRDAAAVDYLTRLRIRRMDINTNFWYDLTVGLMGKLAKGMLALKNEYKTGLVSLMMLNLLLLVVNLIDINYLWIHFTYTPSVDLFTMVHEGTDLLILSIVLAMLVLLIFFRGNLNFYKKNKWLKTGAYIWLFQNAVLVISVLLRDYYYIREFGLAYKRIGVLFFLLLVIGGLVTVFLKIRYAKTNYYLWRVNAWTGVILLVLAAAIQWDVLIAAYNIAHRTTAPLNLPYLLTLSDKVLPVLNENLTVLKQREEELRKVDIYMGSNKESLQDIIASRLKTYKLKQQQESWLSWNLTDAAEKKYFWPTPATHDASLLQKTSSTFKKIQHE